MSSLVLTAAVEDEHEDEDEDAVGGGQVDEQPAAATVAGIGHLELRRRIPGGGIS